jgi:hypothetical protein
MDRVDRELLELDVLEVELPTNAYDADDPAF